MSGPWVGFLALAKKLAQEDDEASQRSAISRAYYAAFNVACEHLVANGVHLPRGDKHQLVWNFLQHGQARNTFAAARGPSLRTKRNRADYDVVLPWNLAKTAKQACADAEQIIQSF